MRKSPLKQTNDKSLSRSKLAPSSSSPNIVSSSLYYCHYRNAMYMGGIKSFKKDGRGILLHDNGVSLISSYSNDLLHGHNIFFSTDSLVSAYFTKNKPTQVVYRIEGFLLLVNYNAEKELQGKALLLNYIAKSIVRAVFKKATMVDRSEQGDFNLLNRVFQLGDIDLLIGRTHANVMRYEFQKLPNIAHQKQGNKIIIGFQKNGFINGLGFSFLYRGQHGGYNLDTHRHEDEFQLQVVDRGYYINTQLNGMGQKMFKNKNFYVGQFKNGVFEGHGILKNHEKQNWVSGYFHDGNLVELLEYNSEGETKQYDKIIEALHQRKTNWINNDVQLIDFSFLTDQVEKMMNTVPNRHLRTLQERKQEVLKKIQQKFICETSTSTFDHQLAEEALNQPLDTGAPEVSKFINNFTPVPHSKHKKPLQLSDQDREGISFQANLFNKTKSSNNLDSFGNSRSQDRPSKRTYASPSPQPNSTTRRIVRSPNWGISRQSSSREEGKSLTPLPRSEAKQKSWVYSGQFVDSRYRREQADGSVGAHGNGLLIAKDHRAPLDSKRMVNKNKIFKYLQNQDTKNSPQFSYTKVDKLQELQKRRKNVP